MRADGTPISIRALTHFQHPSPLPSLIDLLRSSTQSVRQELAAVQAKYKQVQQVHDQMEAERIAREKSEAQKDAANAAFAARVRAQHASSTSGTPSPAGTPSSTPARSAPAPSASTPAGQPPPRPNGSPMPVRPPPATPSPAVARPSPGPSTPMATPAMNGTPGPRPRGRPPKARTDGLRETVLKGGPATPSTPATLGPQRPPTTPSASTSTSASPAVRPPNAQTPGQPSTPANGSAEKKGPVAMSLPTKILPQFVSLGILNHPPDPSRPTPGTLLRTTPDKKHVVVSV